MIGKKILSSHYSAWLEVPKLPHHIMILWGNANVSFFLLIYSKLFTFDQWRPLSQEWAIMIFADQEPIGPFWVSLLPLLSSPPLSFCLRLTLPLDQPFITIPVTRLGWRLQMLSRVPPLPFGCKMPKHQPINWGCNSLAWFPNPILHHMAKIFASLKCNRKNHSGNRDIKIYDY